jgi:hypothetical protein
MKKVPTTTIQNVKKGQLIQVALTNLGSNCLFS